MYIGTKVKGLSVALQVKKFKMLADHQMWNPNEYTNRKQTFHTTYLKIFKSAIATDMFALYDHRFEKSIHYKRFNNYRM